MQGKRSLGHLEPLMTIQELADYLRCSTRWIEVQMEEGLPSIKRGRLRRFQPSKVVDWLERESDR